MKGTVKWFDTAKGYGFITTDEGKELFIHYSSIKTEGFKQLKRGQKVEFEIIEGDRGPQASEVIALEE
jgi:CspA family cold shock protein